MGAASERRALLMEANDDYNPYLTIDVNEYLIEEWPTLNCKTSSICMALVSNR